MIRASILIAVEQAASEIRAREPFEVHGEEPDIGQYIAVAKPVVELQTVEDARPVE